ncbi:MAG TPA: hypothetical protein VIM56_07370 [Rhizomicrobium sp.]
MKIFWSWQSDTPGKIGRHFVRKALDAAVAGLKQDWTLVEPSERDNIATIHVDQDRQDEPGSPDLARLIQKKIDAAAVVVADVTAVGVVTASESKKRATPKKLANTNVALEAGYALRAHSDRFVLFVFNEHYGAHEDLPFDLRHKGGSITFNLGPSASKAEIAAELKLLAARFVKALKLCIAAKLKDGKANASPSAAAPMPGPSLFFKRGEVLASLGEPEDNQHLSFRSPQVAYLRLISSGNAPGNAKVLSAVRQGRFLPMIPQDGGTFLRNEDGAAVVTYTGRDRVTSITQVYSSGEIWGVNGTILSERNAGASGRLLVLPSVSFEKLYVATLRNYVAAAMNALGRSAPFTVIMGIEGAKGAYITAPGGELRPGQYLGPIYKGEYQVSETMSGSDDNSIKAALRTFFNGVFDLAAANRSDIFTDEIIAAHDLPFR